MTSLRRVPRSGLSLSVPTPAGGDGPPRDHITEEAAIVAPGPGDPRIDLLVDEGATLAEGAPIARLWHRPEVQLVAPMPARVARVSFRPGHRLGEIVLFRDSRGDRLRHRPEALQAGSPEALAQLLMSAGFWPRLRSRPFGRMPSPAERPAAILVMAHDTRPLAPAPARAIGGREEALLRGLAALTALAEGPVYLCQPERAPVLPGAELGPGITPVPLANRHPQGAPGVIAHRLCPADITHRVWDVDAEDVAHLGTLLETGHLPQSRLVRVAGPALTETRLLRCQIGADTRSLCYGATLPGPHVVLAGSPVDGRPSRWLGPRDRQVTVLPPEPAAPLRHWFLSALTRSATAPPIIPTAALTQATGGGYPAAALVRALSVGDDETALRLGALSLVEEDLALADYTLGGTSGLPLLLRAFLDRVAAETDEAAP